MTIRRAVADDLRFVRSAWLSSYASSDFAKLHTPTDVWARRDASAEYYRGQRELIEAVLARSTVLVSEEHPSMLDAFACFAGRTLHYVYVRQSARGHGHARALCTSAGLLDGAPVTYTHRSRGLVGGRIPRAWKFSVFALLLSPNAGGKAA